MKFSQSWLRYWVDTDLSADALSESLTMVGLEVEEMETAAPFFKNVVIAEILDVQKHLNADKLHVCSVNVGDEKPLQIVCGAPNAKKGIRVPCALIGAELPGKIKIKATKMRGVESQGMLCSAKELGINADHSGLLVLPEEAPVGVSVREYLDLDDVLYTIKLTPNRADCLSILGVAREVQALTGAPLQWPMIPEKPAQIHESRGIFLDSPKLCPRYLGRIFKGVNAKAETPEWMKNRLERSGLRSVSALVDITNYVMMELGQPLHAFDNAKLQGDIHVRLGDAGERLKLLNGDTIDLNGVLTIRDDSGAIAAAGLMGGDKTAITLDTAEVFLESAFFSPAALAGKARHFNLNSDAAYRYERGVDFEGCLAAMHRASDLILSICGGKAGEIVEALSFDDLPIKEPITLRHSRLEKILGVKFDVEDIEGILGRLNFEFETDYENSSYQVEVPSFRFDLEIEEDLIEEVVRIYGYEEIPADSPTAPLLMPAHRDFVFTDFSKNFLVDRGFFEVINFAFVSDENEKDFCGNDSPIALANPIASHLSVLRSSLIAGLVENLSKNLKQKQSRVRLFEVGRVFYKNADSENFAQPWHLAGLMFGNVVPQTWGNVKRNVDFFDVKGEVESLLNKVKNVRFEALENHSALHPGRAAKIFIDNKAVGILGELHPKHVQAYDFPSAPMVFEIDLSQIPPKPFNAFAPIAKFPMVVRDLAVVVKKHISLDFMRKNLENTLPKLVKDIVLFDVYTGAGIPEDCKSLAFRVSLQDTQKTLGEAEVESALSQILDVWAKTCSAVRRE